MSKQKNLAITNFTNRLNRQYPEGLPKNGCWEWTSANSAGYGTIPDDNGKQCQAHRFSFEYYHFTIPKGYCVLHVCNNTICINPQHLVLGTKASNSLHMRLSGRQSRFEDRKPRVPLTLHVAFGRNYNQIAKHLGRDRQHIKKVVETYLKKHTATLIETLESAIFQLEVMS